MGIDAIALLRGRDLPLPSGDLVQTLDDAVLVRTHAPFGADPEEVADALRSRLGEALDAHVDPRGVFLIPDVAHPKARTYDGVIDEIGEAGEWISLEAAAQLPGSLVGTAMGGFADAMSELMAALGPDAIGAMQRAMESGDANELADVQAKLVAALGGEDKVEAFAEKLTAAAEAAIPGGLATMQNLVAHEGLAGDGPLDPDAVRSAAEQLGLDPAQVAEMESRAREQRKKK